MLRTVQAQAVAPIQGPPGTGVTAGGAPKGWPAVLKRRVLVSKPARHVRKSGVARTYRVVRHAAGYLPRHAAGAGRYSAAVAYAYAQLGSRYVYGAAGGGAFDCSGLMMRAYQRAGLRLPHSSGGQAARAYPIRRSQARPGDLVVGAGHVGIYVGNGYMIDAGNPRVGVSKRRLYGGLRVERF